MQLEDYYEIGFIIKPHGLKGAVSFQLDVDDPSKYKKMESVIVKTGEQLVPFLISSLQINGNKGIMHLVDIHTIDAAEELKSCQLLLPIETLPELREDQFYYHEVIGYQVVDEAFGTLGTIQNIFSTGRQDLISMMYNEHEVLIPVADDIVLKADHNKKEVYVILPEGLLDIYL
jgi:16S rRNA processing protein RimM